MKLIIQKCTELGVKEITPVETERCIVKLDDKSASKKQERWQKIAEVAAKQSGRNIIPKINNLTNIKNICNILKDYDIVLVPYENEKNITLNVAKQLGTKIESNYDNIKVVSLVCKLLLYLAYINTCQSLAMF